MTMTDTLHSVSLAIRLPNAYFILDASDYPMGALRTTIPNILRFSASGDIKQWNIPVSYHYTLAQTEQELWTFISEMQTKRLSLPFEIDGIVIKIDNLKAQELLGSTAKSPRWAVAYKFAAEQARTQILDITVQVGRTGVLTPVAELDPVPLSGSIISRATLHNQEEIERKDIRVGDFVWIEKGGDVIPKVLSVDVDARVNSSVVWSLPLYCPSCAQAVQSIPGEVAARCTNHEKCPEQILRQLIYFVSKPALRTSKKGSRYLICEVDDETGKAKVMLFNDKIDQCEEENNDSLPKEKNIVVVIGQKQEDNTIFGCAGCTFNAFQVSV